MRRGVLRVRSEHPGFIGRSNRKDEHIDLLVLFIPQSRVKSCNTKIKALLNFFVRNCIVHDFEISLINTKQCLVFITKKLYQEEHIIRSITAT